MHIQRPKFTQSPEFSQVRKYIGRSFREKLMYTVPEWFTDEEIADYLVQRAICVHLGEDTEAKGPSYMTSSPCFGYETPPLVHI